VSDGTNQSTETKTGYIVVGGSSLYEYAGADIKVYPVPAQGTLHIESPVSIVKLIVADLTGREIMTISETGKLHAINISNLKEVHTCCLSKLRPGSWSGSLRLNNYGLNPNRNTLL
jgi:hypothetical protein